MVRSSAGADCSASSRLSDGKPSSRLGGLTVLSSLDSGAPKSLRNSRGSEAARFRGAGLAGVSSPASAVSTGLASATCSDGACSASATTHRSSTPHAPNPDAAHRSHAPTSARVPGTCPSERVSRYAMPHPRRPPSMPASARTRELPPSDRQQSQAQQRRKFQHQQATPPDVSPTSANHREAGVAGAADQQIDAPPQPSAEEAGCGCNQTACGQAPCSQQRQQCKSNQNNPGRVLREAPEVHAETAKTLKPVVRRRIVRVSAPQLVVFHESTVARC